MITIYLGNKNYSSWSLRAWLALRSTGAPFREEVFDLTAPGIREAIRKRSPTGRVPALEDGEVRVWDSLAIGEYLAEKFPGAGLWPADSSARATARSVVAEMHSGFLDLRRHMPMNVRRSSPGKGRAQGVEADIERIRSSWRHCRERFGARGDFLFGACSLADCFYAPVATRFATYAVELDPVGRAYRDSILALPAMQEWRSAAEREPATDPACDL